MPCRTSPLLTACVWSTTPTRFAVLPASRTWRRTPPASTDPTTPYNQLITSGLSKALPSLQKIGYEPRAGFDFLPFGAQSHTTVRGGFGMFADAFPGQIADTFLNNAPTNVPFTIYGPAFGGSNTTLLPTAPGSASSAAIAANAAFVAGYAAGGSNSTGLPAPNISTAVSKIYNRLR